MAPHTFMTMRVAAIALVGCGERDKARRIGAAILWAIDNDRPGMMAAPEPLTPRVWWRVAPPNSGLVGQYSGQRIAAPIDVLCLAHRNRLMAMAATALS